MWHAPHKHHRRKNNLQRVGVKRGGERELERERGRKVGKGKEKKKGKQEEEEEKDVSLKRPKHTALEVKG